MNRLLKTAILSTAVAATTLSALPSAQADDWGGRRYYRHHGSGDLVAAGVLGLAVGALAAGLTTPRRDVPYYVDEDYVDRAPPRRAYVVREPQVIYADRYSSYEPWTRDWYQYCSDRYRSFNPRTGTFVGYDGVRRFCEAN